MWFRSATEGERTKLLKLFSRNNFYLDIPMFISERMDKLAASFVPDQNHILNSCYSRSRKYFSMPRVRTKRFLHSFIPQSIQVLNSLCMTI